MKKKILIVLLVGAFAVNFHFISNLSAGEGGGGTDKIEFKQLNKMKEYTNRIRDVGQLGKVKESCSNIPLNETHLNKIKKIKGLESLMNDSSELGNYKTYEDRYLDGPEAVEEDYGENKLIDIDIDEKHQIAVCLTQDYRKEENRPARDYDEITFHKIYVFNKGKIQGADTFTPSLRHWRESSKPYEFNGIDQDLNKIEISKESEEDRIVVNAFSKNNKKVYKILFDKFVSPQEVYHSPKAKLIQGEIKMPNYSEIASLAGPIR